MARGASPTVHSRRLGKELRALRDQRQLTCEQVGHELSCSASRISRIESGEIKVRPGDVHELLDLYLAPDETREALLAMSRQAREEGWWHRYGDVLSRRFLTYVAMEAEATAQYGFEPALVPGLLQTEDYMRSVIRQAMIQIGREKRRDPEEIEQRVAVRMARQSVLRRDDPLELYVVVDESALRRFVGGSKIMRAQLLHLVEVLEWQHIRFQVLPFARGAHPLVAGSVHILEFSDPADRTIALSENALGELYEERPSEIRALKGAFDQLVAMALSPEESLAMAARLANEI